MCSDQPLHPAPDPMWMALCAGMCVHVWAPTCTHIWSLNTLLVPFSTVTDPFVFHVLYPFVSLRPQPGVVSDPCLEINGKYVYILFREEGAILGKKEEFWGRWKTSLTGLC